MSNINLSAQQFLDKIKSKGISATGNLLKTGEESVPLELAAMKRSIQEKKLLKYQIETRTPINEFLKNKYGSGEFNSAEINGYDNSLKRIENGISYEYHVYFDDDPNKVDLKDNGKYFVTNPIENPITGDSYIYHIPIHKSDKDTIDKYNYLTDIDLEKLDYKGKSVSKDGLVYAFEELKNKLNQSNPNVNSATYSILKKHGFLDNNGQLKLDIDKGYAVEKYLKSIVPTKRNDAIIYLNKLYAEDKNDKIISDKVEKEIEEIVKTSNKGKAKLNLDNKDYIDNKKLNLISELEKYTLVKPITDEVYKNFNNKSEEIYNKGVDIKSNIDKLYKEELELGKLEHKKYMEKYLKDITTGTNLTLIKDIVPEEFTSESALKLEIERLENDKKTQEKKEAVDKANEKAKANEKELLEKELLEKAAKYKLENTTKIEEYKTEYEDFEKMLKDIKMYTEKGVGKIGSSSIDNMNKTYATYNKKINEFKKPDSPTLDINDEKIGLAVLTEWLVKLKPFHVKYKNIYQIKVIDAPAELTEEEKKYKERREKDDLEVKINEITFMIDELKIAQKSNKLDYNTRKLINADIKAYEKIMSNKSDYAKFINLYVPFAKVRVPKRIVELETQGYRIE